VTPAIVVLFDDILPSTEWYLDVGNPFYIKCQGFRNPRTTRVTATFQIDTKDSAGYYLEQRTTGITTQMLSTPKMPTFDVQMSNFTNGDINTYTVTMYSPLPHFSGDIIWFTFPPQILLPSVVNCVAISALTAITCQRLGQSEVSGVMTFIGDFNEVGTMITFQVL